ncbi:MAG: hypothetical protein KGK07_02565 [Chloroflexota bacterium]|nr:hypothetical protein [Chloroflexota bacterium]
MMSRRVPSRGFAAGLAIVLAAAVVAATTGFLGVMPASSQAQVVQVRAAPSVPRDDPFAAFWNNVQPVDVALSAQNITRPMGGGTVAAVQLRAAHDGKRLYILSEWSDATQDAAIDTTTSFTDAAAVEFPAAGTTRIPSFCMGDPGAGVNIWHWKAAWQRDVDSGFATNRARYANMQVDLYPQDGDTTFQTGLAAGNPLSAQKHGSPVENLVAAQFGTLTNADVQDVGGVGRWKDGRWRVLFVRSLAGAEGSPSFAPGGKTNAAFAVWNGSDGQRDGIKSVSQFVDLQISGEKIVRKPSSFAPAIIAFAGIVGGLAVIAVFGVFAERRKRV